MKEKLRRSFSNSKIYFSTKVFIKEKYDLQWKNVIGKLVTELMYLLRYEIKFNFMY